MPKYHWFDMRDMIWENEVTGVQIYRYKYPPKWASDSRSHAKTLGRSRWIKYAILGVPPGSHADQKANDTSLPLPQLSLSICKAKLISGRTFPPQETIPRR